jgi:radical SAM superfamily enzyme YgiQ (UPF0313 family)
MYKDKKFRIRNIREVLEDFDRAAAYVRQGYLHQSIADRVFLADGNALALKNDHLLVILNHIARLFPACQRVSLYGSPQDVLRKTPAELEELKENGLRLIYIGAESGSSIVLENVRKGASREEIIASVRKIEESGIQSSVTFISGLGGKEHWKEHGAGTGSMISQMEPSYAGLLTLMIDPAAPIHTDIENGKFRLLSPEEVIQETILLLKNIAVNKTCIFRSNHASNYFSLKGNLPQDQGRMIHQLEKVLENSGCLKDERFRLL